MSVLSGGMEAAMLDSDIGLENLANYGIRPAIYHMATMTTLAFEHIAGNDKKVTFFHVFPGSTATDLWAKMTAPDSFGVIGRVVFVVMRTIGATMLSLLGQKVGDCGARQAYVLTSEKYGAGEVWRIDDKSEAVTKPGVLERYREDGWRLKVWQYTTSGFDRALTAGA